MGLGDWLRFSHVSRCFKSKLEDREPIEVELEPIEEELEPMEVELGEIKVDLEVPKLELERIKVEEGPIKVEEYLIRKAACQVLDEKGWAYSPRIERLREERWNNSGKDLVESEVEASRVTWSELSSSSELKGTELADDNTRVFKALQERWGDKFFQEWREGDWELVGKFAEGAQAELFELRRLWFPNDAPWVMKMFKEGFSLEDLQRLLPRGMLADAATRKWGYFHGGSSCNAIRGAMLFDGRFALLMDRKWGDLRKLIDVRMTHGNGVTDPFLWSEMLHCMLQIARGMEALHEKDIIHGDLKASNILVCGGGSLLENPHLLDPLGDIGEFKYYVADYECSVGVVGTGFWRAPEILLAVKNGNVTPQTFTKECDVYSYGMICYEILTSRVPFELEGFRDNEYDRVIDGCRPVFPTWWASEVCELMEKCWHPNPSERPTFKLICDEIQSANASNGFW